MRCSLAQLQVSLFTLLGAIAFAGPLACGGDDDGTSDSTSETSASTGETGETGEMADGVTDCTPPGLDKVVCQAGQYCADSVLGDCENGCLSDDNCTSEQVCEKADGEDVGSCQAKGSAGPTEEAFCSKLLTCDMTGTMEQCSVLYKATNAGCHECVVDGNCGDINDGSCDEACGF